MSTIGNNIIQAFYDGMKHRPNSTFGTVNSDVLAFKDKRFQPINFCRVILNSAWRADRGSSMCGKDFGPCLKDEALAAAE